MRHRINVKVVAIAAVALLIGLSAPAVGRSAQQAIFADNSDKVDGRHAVGPGATLNKARNKLVAHDRSGKLPAKFIPKVNAAKRADNAVKVGGLPASTLTGQFYVMGAATAASQVIGEGLSFGFRLPSIPVAHFVKVGAVPPAGCPGSEDNPKAAPGHLCLYEGGSGNVTTFRGADQVTASGSGVVIQSAAAGHTFSYGTWAVRPGSAASRTTGHPGVTD